MNQTPTPEFEEAKNKLTQCQEEKNLSSCMQCPHVLECTIRQAYVKATYSYLNKGGNGEFDF